MILPQSIRQGDTGRCDQNGLGGAEKWTSVSPCRQRGGVGGARVGQRGLRGVGGSGGGLGLVGGAGGGGG